MPVRLSTFPAQPSCLQTCTLDGAQYQVRLSWQTRNNGWYLDLLKSDGTALLTGRRLSPGASFSLGHQLGSEDGPPGQFYVRGQDGYQRLALGASLSLLYYSEAEMRALFAAQPTADQPTVAVV